MSMTVRRPWQLWATRVKRDVEKVLRRKQCVPLLVLNAAHGIGTCISLTIIVGSLPATVTISCSNISWFPLTGYILDFSYQNMRDRKRLLLWVFHVSKKLFSLFFVLRVRRSINMRRFPLRQVCAITSGLKIILLVLFTVAWPLSP